MKWILALTTATVLAASPALAAEEDLEELMKKFEEFSDSTQQFLEGWMEELGPTLEELGPALEELAEQIGDWSMYEPPEVLENGDIIIRRKKRKEVPEPAPEIEETLPGDDSIEL